MSGLFRPSGGGIAGTAVDPLGPGGVLIDPSEITSLPLHGATHEALGSDPVPSIPTVGQKAALPGTFGAPGPLNKFVTDTDPRNTNARTPTAHAGTHEDGGTDELDVTGLSGLLADPQTPLAHEATHKSGGTDPFLSTDLLEAIVKRLRESGGPTTLTLGVIAAGNLFKRSGTSIVGVESASESPEWVGIGKIITMTNLDGIWRKSVV